MKAGIHHKKTLLRVARSLRRRAIPTVVLMVVLALLLGTARGAEQGANQTAATPPTTEVPEDEFGRGSPQGAVKGYFAACREGN
jgi:hypothetical protein